MPSLNLDDHEMTPTPGRSLDERVIAAAGTEAMLDAIDMLPLAHREVLILFFARNLSYQEIAEALAISPEAVQSRLHAARAALTLILIERQTL
jgi:RNA polymerase sigma-70 factor (ECF subfamily)